MTNPYLESLLHDEDLHVEWLRLDAAGWAAIEQRDLDLRDDVYMRKEQIREVLASRLRRPH